MNDAELGGVVRALRHRRGWRQVDLARKAGVSAPLISGLERGRADLIALANLRRVTAALDLRLEWDIGYRGAELARLRDADHARLAETMTRRLESRGWSVAAEASFNHYGDRGRIDLLAYHTASRTLLVVEIKTLIVEIQELLGKLSVYQRVGIGVAGTLDWKPMRAVPLLVVADTTTNRRRIVAHERLFARLPMRGTAALAWLHTPTGTPDGLLLHVKLPNFSGGDVRRAGRQRVRVGRKP